MGKVVFGGILNTLCTMCYIQLPPVMLLFSRNTLWHMLVFVLLSCVLFLGCTESISSSLFFHSLFFKASFEVTLLTTVVKSK